jgi:hypothetical protein
MFVIFATEASTNHGNSENGTNSSLPASHIQKPWLEMFVTSTSEAFTPCGCDFICTSLDYFSKNGDLARRDSAILGKLDAGLKPELRFAFGREDVYVHTRLFARKKKKRYGPSRKMVGLTPLRSHNMCPTLQHNEL